MKINQKNEISVDIKSLSKDEIIELRNSRGYSGPVGFQGNQGYLPNIVNLTWEEMIDEQRTMVDKGTIYINDKVLGVIGD